MLTTQKSKVSHSYDNDNQGENEDEQKERLGAKSTKIKRRDVELPMAEADVKLAEKLDNCLKISDTRKARFFMNKPKTTSKNENQNHLGGGRQTSPIKQNLDMGGLKAKNLSKEQLRERLLKKYDTLVTDSGRNRGNVKVLTAIESLEMAKVEAKKQLVDQLELNSISGNQRAYINGIERFRFNDGYEMPTKGFYSKKFNVFQNSEYGSNNKSKNTNAGDTTTTKMSSQSNPTKSVRFADDCEIKIATRDDDIDESSNPYDIFLDDDDSLTDEYDDN